MNFKKRKHIFILTGGLLLIILTALLPLNIAYFNSVHNMYCSYYRNIKNFSEDISNYTVGVEGSLRFYLWGVHYETEGDQLKIVGYYCEYGLDLTPFSSEGTNITGILFYTYECLLDGVSENNYSKTIDHASLIEESGKIDFLNISTRITIRGSIEIEYTSNATPFTEVIDFSLDIAHPDGRPEYIQALSLASSLSFWHIASFIIVPVLIAFIYQHGKKPQMTREDEEFWRKVRERNKLLREKNGEEESI